MAARTLIHYIDQNVWVNNKEPGYGRADYIRNQVNELVSSEKKRTKQSY
jgi:hypothetical protein